MTDWTIRPIANEADADALALIGAATFLESFAGILDGAAILAHCRIQHAPDAYRQLLAGGASGFLAEAKTGGAPIGYALLSMPDLPGQIPGDLELKRIYLLSRWHGQGPGPALMTEAIAHARQRRASRLLLGVYAGNHRALAFYRRHGFVQIDTRVFMVGGKGYDDVVLARPL